MFASNPLRTFRRQRPSQAIIAWVVVVMLCGHWLQPIALAVTSQPIGSIELAESTVTSPLAEEVPAREEAPSNQSSPKEESKEEEPTSQQRFRTSCIRTLSVLHWSDDSDSLLCARKAYPETRNRLIRRCQSLLTQGSMLRC